jgi:hypothetical protein
LDDTTEKHFAHDCCSKRELESTSRSNDQQTQTAHKATLNKQEAGNNDKLVMFDADVWGLPEGGLTSSVLPPKQPLQQMVSRARPVSSVAAGCTRLLVGKQWCSITEETLSEAHPSREGENVRDK